MKPSGLPPILGVKSPETAQTPATQSDATISLFNAPISNNTSPQNSRPYLSRLTTPPTLREALIADATKPFAKPIGRTVLAPIASSQSGSAQRSVRPSSNELPQTECKSISPNPTPNTSFASTNDARRNRLSPITTASSTTSSPVFGSFVAFSETCSPSNTTESNTPPQNNSFGLDVFSTYSSFSSPALSPRRKVVSPIDGKVAAIAAAKQEKLTEAEGLYKTTIATIEKKFKNTVAQANLSSYDRSTEPNVLTRMKTKESTITAAKNEYAKAKSEAEITLFKTRIHIDTTSLISIYIAKTTSQQTVTSAEISTNSSFSVAYAAHSNERKKEYQCLENLADTKLEALENAETEVQNSPFEPATKEELHRQLRTEITEKFWQATSDFINDLVDSDTSIITTDKESVKTNLRKVAHKLGLIDVVRRTPGLS